MEQNLFNGQLIVALSAFIGIGGAVLALGKVFQKVEQLHKDNKDLKESINEVRIDLKTERLSREEWREHLEDKLSELQHRTIVLETKLGK